MRVGPLISPKAAASVARLARRLEGTYHRVRWDQIGPAPGWYVEPIDGAPMRGAQFEVAGGQT